MIRIASALLGWHALPLILPIVLYHGAKPWSVPLSFDAMFALPAGVRTGIDPYLIQSAYLIDDLSEIPDDQLRSRAMTALAKLATLCFKHARNRADLLDRLSSCWADPLREAAGAPNGLEALAMVMRYILLVNDHVEPEALQAVLDHAVGPQGPRMSNSLALAADPSRLASLPAPVLGSHPSRMLPSGPRRRLAIRAPRPRSSIELLIRGP